MGNVRRVIKYLGIFLLLLAVGLSLANTMELPVLSWAVMEEDEEILMLVSALVLLGGVMLFGWRYLGAFLLIFLGLIWGVMSISFMELDWLAWSENTTCFVMAVLAFAGVLVADRKAWMVQACILSAASVIGCILSVTGFYMGSEKPLNYYLLRWWRDGKPGADGLIDFVLMSSVWLFVMLLGYLLLRWRERLISTSRSHIAKWILPALLVLMVVLGGLYYLQMMNRNESQWSPDQNPVETPTTEEKQPEPASKPVPEVDTAPASSDAPSLEAAQQAMLAEDYPRARTIYLALAADGNAEANYGLGNLYLVGLGVEASESMAIAWLRIAAEKSHPAAMYTLGKVLSRDPKQRAEGKKWIAKAAAAGYPPPSR